MVEVGDGLGTQVSRLKSGVIWMQKCELVKSWRGRFCGKYENLRLDFLLSEGVG